jgi:hypothetical protein
VSPESKAELKRRKSAGDPVELNNQLNRAIERLLKLNRKKTTCNSPPVRRLNRPKRSDLGRVLVLKNRPLFGWIIFEATQPQRCFKTLLHEPFPQRFYSPAVHPAPLGGYLIGVSFIGKK